MIQGIQPSSFLCT